MEQWKKVRGYDYYVSTYGRIKNKKNQLLNGTKTKDGYIAVYLWKKGISKREFLHRLVLKTFKPVKDSKNLHVNHINYTRDDNKLENLEWTTPFENNNKRKPKKVYYNSKGCYDEKGNWFNSYREAGRTYHLSEHTVEADVTNHRSSVPAKPRMRFYSAWDYLHKEREV